MNLAKLYFGIKLLPFFIFLAFVVIVLILLIVIYIWAKFDKSVNCENCKHYELNNVASCGDTIWMKCKKHNRIDRKTANNRSNYVKCDDFAEKL